MPNTLAQPAPSRELAQHTWNLVIGLCAPLSWEMERLPEPAEWEAVGGILQQLRFGALAYHNLKARGHLDDVPSNVADRLQSEHAHALARYHMLGAMVVPHLKAFAAQIEFIVLKGTAWAHAVYPSPHLRQWGDLDLLVRPKEVPRAVAALESLGFESDYGLGAEHGPTFRLWNASGEQVYMELHPDVSRPGAYPYLRGWDVWDQPRAVEMWGGLFLTPMLEIGYVSTLFQLCWDLWQGAYARYVVDHMYFDAAPGLNRDLAADMTRASGVRGVEHFVRCMTLCGDWAAPPHRLAGMGGGFLRRHPGVLLRHTASRTLRSLRAVAATLLWDHWDDRSRFYRDFLGHLPGRAVNRCRLILQATHGPRRAH